MTSLAPNNFSATPTRTVTVTVTGTGFTATSVVENASNVAYPTSFVSATSLTFDVPVTAGSAGSAVVHVANDDADSNTQTLTWTA